MVTSSTQLSDRSMVCAAYSAWFARTKEVSLLRSETACDLALERVRYAVSTVRFGFGSGLALVSVSMDELISEVRTALEIAGVAQMSDSGLVPGVDVGPEVAKGVSRIQASIDMFVELFKENRGELVSQQAKTAGFGGGQVPSFMQGYEVIIAGVSRQMKQLREHEQWGAPRADVTGDSEAQSVDAEEIPLDGMSQADRISQRAGVSHARH